MFAVVNVEDFEIREATLNTEYLPDYPVKEITGFSEFVNEEDILTLDFNSVNNKYYYQDLAIGDEAFKDNAYIENIVLCYRSFFDIYSYRIHRIGDSAFENCTALKSVEQLPENKRFAFPGCADWLIEIGSKAFKGCTLLDEFIMPTSVMLIDSEAFADCTSLKRVVIYENVVEIADNAFENCDNLTIYGKNNTVAHQYAKDKGIPFVSIDCDAEDVMELHNSIMYINTMLYSGTDALYPYYVYTNFEQYYFYEVWSDELAKVLSPSKKVFENPFATKSDIITASENAKEAIYKAELIEEIYHLIKPEFCNDYSYQAPGMHHNKVCWHCAKAMFCLKQNMWIGELFTSESAQVYLQLEDEVYQIEDISQMSIYSLEEMRDKVKKTIDDLVFKEDADLQADLYFLTNVCDLSIYTPDSVENLNAAIESVQNVQGTSSKEFSANNFSYAIEVLREAVCRLELNNYQNITRYYDAVIDESDKYIEVLKNESYKYTDSSMENLNSAITEAYMSQMRYPNVSLSSLASVKEMISEFERANTEIETLIDKMEKAYEALEPVALGDINKDGEKTVYDVVCVLKHIVDPYYFTEQEEYLADVNCDNNVTVMDVILIQKEILQMEQSY